ncbi:ATP-dependent RNA helicase DDX54 isoform X2 [Lycorma delicatula]
MAQITGSSDIGFGDEESENDQFPNANKTKNLKKLGGFHTFGLSLPLIKGIQKKGYKTPTPIQRKTIPFALEGRDVVAMARTGSGKTACFLIPLFEKLKKRAGKNSCGIRALILSPTRELAIQTLKFVKELGKFTGLRSSIVLGGDPMESQFSALHANPDLIVATPGRFLHVCVEMNLRLSSVEYVVFDEADRLFEMGFGEQLQEIIKRLPEARQTLLFSATLPKVLVEFARAGLSDPVLVRLDVESKIPSTLKLSFVSCPSDEKPAALLCLLKHVVSSGNQSIIFAATKHHVEYLHKLLEACDIKSTYIYSDLDPTARKINAAKFQTKKVQMLVVTDVAARGIDIPHLDVVINYNFPAKPKLFVHRVGRCARAGREGHAYSLVSSDETCYLLDLLLFLGRPINLLESGVESKEEDAVGCIPRGLIEEELSRVLQLHETNFDLSSLVKVSSNAYKNYLRSRPGASRESVKRVKEINWSSVGVHPAFTSSSDSSEELKFNFLSQMKQYRPLGTIFEVGQPSTSEVYNVMKIKRNKHNLKILKYHEKVNDKIMETKALSRRPTVSLESCNSDDITSTFSSIVTDKKRKMNTIDDSLQPEKKRIVRDENYIPYKPVDMHTELGLAVNNFNQEASKAVLDLTGDTKDALSKKGRARMIWDKKKKKMVGVNNNSKEGKIKSESGAWIPASFRSGRYDQWVAKTKADADEESEQSDDENSRAKTAQRPTPHTHWGHHNAKMNAKVKSDLKRPEQILKARKMQEKKKRMSQRKKKSKRR